MTGTAPIAERVMATAGQSPVASKRRKQVPRPDPHSLSLDALNFGTTGDTIQILRMLEQVLNDMLLNAMLNQIPRA